MEWCRLRRDVLRHADDSNAVVHFPGDQSASVFIVLAPLRVVGEADNCRDLVAAANEVFAEIRVVRRESGNFRFEASTKEEDPHVTAPHGGTGPGIAASLPPRRLCPEVAALPPTLATQQVRPPAT